MKARWIAIPMIAGVAACAAVPPPELRDARSEYARASNGMAAQLAPADLHIANTQLKLAEQSFANEGDTRVTRDLAYSADRKARLAEVRAQTIAAQRENAQARADLDQWKDEAVRTTSAELHSAQQTLSVESQALAQAQQEKLDAERRATRAQADLARIASVKEEPRGMVITLSGGVLFESAKHALLPQAQAKLSEVANVLSRQDPDSKIRIIGYTDSQGGETFNLQLSRDRADAVRDYLVSHGIAADRVTSEGLGAANPVADNANAEGRADNRRVEIVVEPKHHQ
jgi:outer membrane protein OmpA-like peptidoglycan-associated protein